MRFGRSSGLVHKQHVHVFGLQPQPASEQRLEIAVLHDSKCGPSWSMAQNRAARIRRDGWTAERQLHFLDALARTRSVTDAARAAGMSRESAYRLRYRPDGALVAAAWDRTLKAPAPTSTKGHKSASPPRSPPMQEARIFPANARKVTKWRKYKDPGFQSWAMLLRDFRTRGEPR